MIFGNHRSIDVYPKFILKNIGNNIPCKSARSAWEKASKGEIALTLLGGKAACSETFAQGGDIEIVIQQKGNHRGQDIMYTAVLHTNARNAHPNIELFRTIASNFKQEK